VEITFEFRGCRPSAKESMMRRARSSIEEFFRTLPLSSVKIIVLGPTRRGDGQKLIKPIVVPDSVRRTDTFPVSVHLQGTQGLDCLLRVEGNSPEQLERLVNRGPYKAPRKKKK
jgi:hypothetical protein